MISERASRALAPEALSEIIHHPNMRIAATLEDALALVRGAAPQEVIFITGSLFLVAEALALLPS